jgi:hypothetical protein
MFGVGLTMYGYFHRRPAGGSGVERCSHRVAMCHDRYSNNAGNVNETDGNRIGTAIGKGYGSGIEIFGHGSNL